MFDLIWKDATYLQNFFINGFIVTLSLLLLITSILTFSYLIFFYLYTVVDSIGVKMKGSTNTIIEQKKVVPAYTASTQVPSIRMNDLSIVHLPESYILYFKVNGETISSKVDRIFFDSVKVRQRVEVDYGHRRLSGTCKAISVRIS